MMIVHVRGVSAVGGYLRLHFVVDGVLLFPRQWHIRLGLFWASIDAVSDSHGELPPLTFITAVPTGWPVGDTDVATDGADVAICEVVPIPLVLCAACPAVLLVHAVPQTPAAAMLMITPTAQRYECMPKAYDERHRIRTWSAQVLVNVLYAHRW